MLEASRMCQASRMCLPFLNSTETRSAARTMNSITEPANSHHVEDSDNMTLLDFICKSREYTALPSVTKLVGKRSFTWNNVINEDMTSDHGEKGKRFKGVCSKKKTKPAMDAFSEKARIVAGQRNDCDDDWTLEMWQKTGRHPSKTAFNDSQRASESNHSIMHTEHVPMNVSPTIASTIIHHAKSVDSLSNAITNSEFILPVSSETSLLVEQEVKVDFINGIAATTVNVSSSSCPASDPSDLKSPNCTAAVCVSETITNKDCENQARYVVREGKDNIWTGKCQSFGDLSAVLQGAFCKADSHSLTSKGLEEERERNEKRTDDDDQASKTSTAEVDSATVSMGNNYHLPTRHKDENDEKWIRPMVIPLSCPGFVKHVPDIMQKFLHRGKEHSQTESFASVIVKDRGSDDHVSGDGKLVLLGNLKESVPFPLTASTNPSGSIYDENGNKIEKASHVCLHSDQSLPFKIESHLSMNSVSRGALSVEKKVTPNNTFCEKHGALNVCLEIEPQKYYQQMYANQMYADCKANFNLARDHRRFNSQPLGMRDFIGQESAPVKVNQTRLEDSRQATGCLEASDNAMHGCLVTSVQGIQQTSDHRLESVEQCQGMVQAINDFDAIDLTEVSDLVDKLLMEDEWISSDETCTSNQFMENGESYGNDAVPGSYNCYNEDDTGAFEMKLDVLDGLELGANTRDSYDSAKIASSLRSKVLEPRSTDISCLRIFEVGKGPWDKSATPSQYPRKRQAISPLSQEKLLRATGRDVTISGRHSSSGTYTLACDQVDTDESHSKKVLGPSGLDVGGNYASTSAIVHSEIQEKTHLGSPSFYQSSSVKHQTYTSQSPYSHVPSSLSTLSNSFTGILSQGSLLQDNIYESIPLVLAESPTQERSLISKCSSLPPCKVILTEESSPQKGILKQFCKQACKCPECLSARSRSDKASKFSKQQMHDIELIAEKLMNELKRMCNLIEEMLLPSFGAEDERLQDEIEEAKNRAVAVREMAKRWLLRMGRDCTRYCRIMDNNGRRKITFADEAGKQLCHVKRIDISS